MIAYCCPNTYRKALFHARKKHENYKSQVPNLFIRQGYPHGDTSFTLFLFKWKEKDLDCFIKIAFCLKCFRAFETKLRRFDQCCSCDF